MKLFCIILALLLPVAAQAQSRLHRADVGAQTRHYEYKCIEKYPELNSDYNNLRKCARAMKGKSVFTFNKEVLEEKFDFRSKPNQ